MHAPKMFGTELMSSFPGRRILKPSSRRGASGQSRVLTPPSSDSNTDQGNRDPDTPLPSVERDAPTSTDRQSTPRSASPTPSLGSVSTKQAVDEDAIVQEMSNMRNLRLTSPETPPSLPHRASHTPSIHVTPSGAPKGASQSILRREDSLAANVAALSIESQKADSLAPTGLQESRSPSPSRRRRSGSGIRRELHMVESEDPPEAFAKMAEVQEALVNARTLPRRMAAVLSSSNLHRENGSSVRKLYQQATRLNDFQLPSSRIVGLVGDSGVGKSSLINSLLDKAGLARAVSNVAIQITYPQANTKMNRAAVALLVLVLSQNTTSTSGMISSSTWITSPWTSSNSNTRSYSELIATLSCYLRARAMVKIAIRPTTINNGCRKSPRSQQQPSRRVSGRDSRRCQVFYCRHPSNQPLQEWSIGRRRYFPTKLRKILSVQSKNAALGREN
jgi:energy-coupling factor transporter ATP-binding protein EcfA2